MQFGTGKAADFLRRLQGVEELDEVVVGRECGDGFGIFCGVIEGEDKGDPGFGDEEGDGGFGAERELFDFSAAGVGAVYGVGCDEKFAADERALGMDGAGVVFKEGAGEAEGEVVAVEFGEIFGGEGSATEELREEASGLEAMEVLLEAGADTCGVGGVEGIDQVGECVCLGGADGDHLAAAGVASFAAGDGSGGFVGAVFGDVDDGIGELAENGEQQTARCVIPGGRGGGEFDCAFDFAAVDEELDMDA
jgi:hypothetical protein